MNTGTWITESDLLEDLVKVAGNARVDETAIVRGRGPPPVRREQEDEEELMMQFGITSKDVNITYGHPDLEGIQEMMKMIDHYGPSDVNSSCSSRERNQLQMTDSKIVISKLNPNTPEFVPNTKQQEKKAAKEVLTSVKKNEEQHQLDGKELEEKVEILRENINDATKGKNKVQKNVAVISLLKLQAMRTNREQSAPILLTPDFFKNSLNSENNVKLPTEVPVTSTCSVMINTYLPRKDDTDKSTTDEAIAAAEIKESVNKVNNWLNPKTTKETVKLHLNPVTFKKKNLSGTSSPSSGESQRKVIIKDEYVPSERARELTDMYTRRVEERNAAAQRDSNIVTLDNLEGKLRARDKMIRLKLRNQ